MAHYRYNLIALLLAALSEGCLFAEGKPKVEQAVDPIQAGLHKAINEAMGLLRMYWPADAATFEMHVNPTLETVRAMDEPGMRAFWRDTFSWFVSILKTLREKAKCEQLYAEKDDRRRAQRVLWDNMEMQLLTKLDVIRTEYLSAAAGKLLKDLKAQAVADMLDKLFTIIFFRGDMQQRKFELKKLGKLEPDIVQDELTATMWIALKYAVQYGIQKQAVPPVVLNVVEICMREEVPDPNVVVPGGMLDEIKVSEHEELVI